MRPRQMQASIVTADLALVDGVVRGATAVRIEDGAIVAVGDPATVPAAGATRCETVRMSVTVM